jgi:osmotically-inducible protein OsmY
MTAEIANNLANKVRKEIINHNDFKDTDKVTVIAEMGQITLRGSVPSKELSAKAETIAKSKEDILMVINELEIRNKAKENQEILTPDEDSEVQPSLLTPTST